MLGLGVEEVTNGWLKEKEYSECVRGDSHVIKIIKRVPHPLLVCVAYNKLKKCVTGNGSSLYLFESITMYVAKRYPCLFIGIFDQKKYIDMFDHNQNYIQRFPFIYINTHTKKIKMSSLTQITIIAH